MRRSAIVVMGLMILALVGAGIGTWYAVPRIITHPQLPIAVVQPTTSAPTPAILLQQADGNLAVVDSQHAIKPLTTDANGTSHIYTFAVPAPDGNSVAYVETLHGSSTVSSSLVIQQLGGARRTVFGSQDLHPFYLHWSPDSQQIAFLSGDSNDMFLQMVGLNGQPAQQIIQGQPSYFAWTPDSHRLLLHTRGEAPAGSLSVWKVGDAQPKPLQLAPAFFRAPVWLPDGQGALVTLSEGAGVVLARLGADGTVTQRLVHAGAGIVFVLAPNGQRVAYVDVTNNLPGFLHLVDSDGQHAHAISKQSAITFLWSPNSDQIAYLTIVNKDDPQSDGSAAAVPAPMPVVLRQQPALRLRWNIYNAANGITHAFQPFTPSTEFINLLPFFDQYAQSIRLWDRKSQQLLYADDKGVWSLDVTTSAVTKVGDGVLGVWMDH